jgi:two-component system phosphate regulon sensor histidine kinase PhoR
MRFRSKVFLAASLVATLSALVSVTLMSWSLRRQTMERVERNLVAQVRLAAELLARQSPLTDATAFDREADSIAALTGLRATLIARDGRVLGDSDVALGDLPSLDNHSNRPEVRRALAGGLGLNARYSTTISEDMLYAAAAVAAGDIAVVRLAIPLVDLQQQMQAVRTVTLIAFAVGMAGALALAWATSSLVSRRVRQIGAVARQYASGDLRRPAFDYGHDEIGEVARVLDSSIRQLGQRVSELTRDRARMEAILSGMVEGVLVVNEKGHLQQANEAARRMLRLDTDAAGRHYLELIRSPAVAECVTAALRGSSPDEIELALGVDRDRIFVARAAPVTSPAGPGAVLVLRDITQLRRADQIRRDFVANVSHELRTPLTAIKGYVEALIEEGDDPGQRQQFLEVIARHTGRMERLVQDLLRLARIEGGQERLEVALCGTAGLFADVSEELAAGIERRRQRIAVDIAPDAATIQADPAKLHDVVRNLVENAVNYGPEDSDISLAARRQDDGTVVLEVADRGPGIPEADLARVFERFYRVDKARAQAPAGTGLGLAIVKHLVGLHGGTATVVNRPGGGARFVVTLPQPPRPRT